MQQWTCGPAVLPHLTDEEIKHNLREPGHQNLGVLQVLQVILEFLEFFGGLKMFEDNFPFTTFGVNNVQDVQGCGWASWVHLSPSG